VTTIAIQFEAVQEGEPDARWQALFDGMWPAYRRWFLHEGEAARAGYAESRRMLREHMPELVPTWERLVELAGGGDVAARMLSMWRPPSYLSGCSQGVLVAGDPILARNYDYAPSRLEGVIWSTGWAGRRVIGMSDCLWGLLDGVNEDGLAISLAFGGRPVVGDGFGIPLIMRYVLQTCSTVDEAQRALARLPHQLAHTLTLVDASGEILTAYLAPDREVQFHRQAAATNHQGTVEWTEHAAATRSIERERRLQTLLDDPGQDGESFAGAFLEPPLYSTDYSKGFGTLYTAVYRPRAGEAEYRWPGTSWLHSFDRFDEGVCAITLAESTAA
jgi:predicted choloylglycine hydrolase